MAEPFGKYQLLKRIAEGGMGEVFLARQQGIEGFEKLLVIKTLLPHLTSQKSFIQMFLDEARIAARLAHANIAQIYDLGSIDDVFYIAMEYVHGEELRDVWKKVATNAQSFPIPLACRIVIEAAHGLGYAHRMTNSEGVALNIVHRDVSPHNLLVTFDGGVKLIDFGIAKASGRVTNTQVGGLKGTYAYMSPEQVDGEDIDSRSDIFALGTILWELVTGSRLFKRDSDVKIMRAVSDCLVPPPSMRNTAVPASIDPIVLKALAHDRNQRYQTMEELALDLENWLAATQNAASSAHLAGFMRHQFADRVAQEGSKGPLWDVDPNASGFGVHARTRATNPSRPPSETSANSLGRGPAFDFAAQKSVTAPPAVAAAKADVSAVSRVARKGIPLWAVLLGFIAVGVVAFLLWPRQVQPTPPLVLTPVPALQPLAPVAPPKPTTAKVKVTSTPSGAVLLDGATELGRTPAELVLARSRDVINLTLKLDGYQPVTKGLDLSADEGTAPLTLDVVLEPVAVVEAPKVEQPKVEPPKPVGGTPQVGAPAPVDPAKTKRPKGAEEVKTFE